MRASLRQAERDPIPAVEQLAVLVAAMDGQFDGLNEADIFFVMGAIRIAAARDLGDIAEQIAQNEPFEDAARTLMITLGQQARATLKDADGTIA